MEFPQRRTACRYHGRGGSLPMDGVAALPWNQRQLSPGIGGRLAMESVAAFVWNRWQLCRGIGGRIRLELVAALAWNTHPGRVFVRNASATLRFRCVDKFHHRTLFFY